MAATSWRSFPKLKAERGTTERWIVASRRVPLATLHCILLCRTCAIGGMASALHVHEPWVDSVASLKDWGQSAWRTTFRT